MQAKVTELSHIKITPAGAMVWGDVSVDTDDDGLRDVIVHCSSMRIPDDLSVTVDLGAGDVDVTTTQALRLIKKLSAKAMRQEARRQAKLNDEMPEEVPE